MKELLVGILIGTLIISVAIGLLYSLGQLNRIVTNFVSTFTYTPSEDFGDTILRGGTTVVILFIAGFIIGCFYSLGNWII